MPRRPAIRTYLILMNLLLLILLFPALNIFILRATSDFRDQQLTRTIKLLESALNKRGETLVRNLSLSASEAVAGYDFSFLLELLNQATQNDNDLLHSYIVALDGRVLADHQQENIGKILTRPQDQQLKTFGQRNFSHQQAKKPNKVIILTEQDISDLGSNTIEVITPVYNGDQLWGLLRCNFSRQTLDAEIQQTKEQWAKRMKSFSILLFSLVGLFLVLGVLVVVYFTKPILSALRALGAGVQRISNGDLDHTISNENLNCSEFVDLAQSFNEMTRSLKDSQVQLAQYNRSLEHKVEARTSELKKAQETLLKQAHEAGMAEMAVGVLHNIGNAITPAKVGAAMLLKRLKESPFQGNLAQALAPLTPLVTQAPELTPQEKQRLQDILQVLPQSIIEEYQQFTNEIGRIREKHEHIESIINLQMRYARLIGKAEAIDLNSLIKDAVNILADAIKKRHIIINLQLGGLPNIELEKAKLIQVIVNLIKNSYEAIDQSQASTKEITITSFIDPSKPGFVTLSIKDSGCGFAKNSESDLFTFGYSSKERGTGFGLHSCANFLIANNGSIKAHSAGPGQGSEFVLLLPIKSPANAQEGE